MITILEKRLKLFPKFFFCFKYICPFEEIFVSLPPKNKKKETTINNVSNSESTESFR